MYETRNMRATTNPFAPWRSVNSEPEEDWVANAKEAEEDEEKIERQEGTRELAGGGT